MAKQLDSKRLSMSFILLTAVPNCPLGCQTLRASRLAIDGQPDVMMLNAFDVDPGVAERTLELQVGELFALGIQADLLVVSARSGVYVPVPGTLVHRLEEFCGLKLGQLPRDLDFSNGPLAAWVSPPLQDLAGEWKGWPSASATRFRRIAVVESPAEASLGRSDSAWPVFRQLFSLLALLPLQGIDTPVVATPLLSAGNQQIAPARLFPALLEMCRGGFRHVPDLQRLILFDRQRLPLEQLADRIDHELDRSSNLRRLLALDPGNETIQQLRRRLAGLERICPDVADDADRIELHHLCTTGEASPLALGMHSRRLLELLVNHQLGWRRRTLYQGLQVLRQQNVSPWLLSCMHQVRVFGNWMGHPSRPGQRRDVDDQDAMAMLTALLRVLEDYPWN